MEATKSTKGEKYTAEQTAEMVEAYKAEPTQETVAVFAERFGKSARSVIAKLTREGVYIKKAYTTKTGEPVVKKDDIADKIGALVGLADSEADSLAKANKSALKKIFFALGGKDE